MIHFGKKVIGAHHLLSCCMSSYFDSAVDKEIVALETKVSQYIGEYPKNWIVPPVDLLSPGISAKLESTNVDSFLLLR